MMIAVLKASKDKSDPSSYRPIALTMFVSCRIIPTSALAKRKWLIKEAKTMNVSVLQVYKND